jgi:hypothetical protein
MPADEIMGPIIALGIAGLVGAIIVYSVVLQRRAVSKQGKAMQALDESIAHQKEMNELLRENNQVLKEILQTLKGKDGA